MRELSHISEHGMIKGMTKKTALTILVLAILAAGTTAVLARMRKEVVALSVPERTPRSLNQEGSTQVTFTVKIDQRVWNSMLQMQGTNGEWQKIAKLHDDGKNGDQTKGDKNYTSIKTIQGQKVTFRVAAKKGLRKLLVSEPFVMEYHPVPPGFKRYEDPDISLIYPDSMTGKVIEGSTVNSKSIEFYNEASKTGFGVDIDRLDRALTVTEWADTQNWPFPDTWRNHFQIIQVNGRETIYDPDTLHYFFVDQSRIYFISNGIDIFGNKNIIDQATFVSILDSLAL